MDEIEIIRVSGGHLINIIEALAKEIWTEHYTPIIGKPQVDYMLNKFQSMAAISCQIQEDGLLYYLLKKNSDDYIGYMAIMPKKDTSELFLSKLYVKHAQRHKGYAKKAMRFIEDLAKQMHLGKITLTVNKSNINSIAAYQKIGFKNAGSVVTDIGAGFVMDDFIMDKAL